MATPKSSNSSNNTAQKNKNQFIALRDQVEAEITDRQTGLLKQAQAEAKAKQEKSKGNIEDLRE